MGISLKDGQRLGNLGMLGNDRLAWGKTNNIRLYSVMWSCYCRFVIPLMAIGTETSRRGQEVCDFFISPQK